MPLLLSHNDLRNIIKIYKIYSEEDINKFINNPNKLENDAFKKSLITLNNTFDDPLNKMQYYYTKYILYNGGRRSSRKSSRKSSKKSSKSSSRKSSKRSRKKRKSRKKKPKIDKLAAMENMAAIPDMADMQNSENIPGMANTQNKSINPLDINSNPKCKVGNTLVIPII